MRVRISFVVQVGDTPDHHVDGRFWDDALITAGLGERTTGIAIVAGGSEALP